MDLDQFKMIIWFIISSKRFQVPALAKIDFYTDFLLVKNRLYVTQLDTKMDNIGILYSSEKAIL